MSVSIYIKGTSRTMENEIHDLANYCGGRMIAHSKYGGRDWLDIFDDPTPPRRAGVGLHFGYIKRNKIAFFLREAKKIVKSYGYKCWVSGGK